MSNSQNRIIDINLCKNNSKDDNLLTGYVKKEVINHIVHML